MPTFGVSAVRRPGPTVGVSGFPGGSSVFQFLPGCVLRGFPGLLMGCIERVWVFCFLLGGVSGVLGGFSGFDRVWGVFFFVFFWRGGRDKTTQNGTWGLICPCASLQNNSKIEERDGLGRPQIVFLLLLLVPCI